MKHAITFLFALLIITTAFGQITTTKVAPKDQQLASAAYDSTVNYLAGNPEKYAGQEFYLKGKAENLRQYGYEGFALDYKVSTFANKSNVYKCCDGSNAKYADLNGKYFKVLEVFRHPKAAEDEATYGHRWYIKLEEKESKDQVYYEYNSKYENKFPFIVVGFFEKQKKKVIGNEYVFSQNALKSKTDLATGKPITNTLGQKWKCLDLTIDEKYYKLSLLLENALGEKITVDTDYMFGLGHEGLCYSAGEADGYRKSFGTENFDLILQKQVKIGFTKEMCRLAWGAPKDVNTTTTAGKQTEQWIYDENYLYFENNVVTAMQ